LKNKLVKRISLFLIIFFVLGALGGCTPKQKKPMPQKKLKSEPTISLYLNDTGQVKRIKMEEYIQGVVAAEMEPDWPVKALAAQAILARTFTLKKMQDSGGVPAHKTDASTSVEEFQAYDAGKINENVRNAVQMTRGQVVKHRGNYINAWFSACDGGTAASAVEGLAFNKEKTPYIRAGAKDGCLSITTPENKQWTASFPLNTVRAAVLKASGKDTGDINSTNVAIIKKGPSGRAEAIKIGKATISGSALRLALGSDKIRSIYLNSLSVSGGNVVMSGKGFGHGVGMCQWGARKMAQEGKGAADIIKFYFKDVTIEKMWK
jgi:stage II sporulation protein D